MKIYDYGPGIIINGAIFAWPGQRQEYMKYVRNIGDNAECYVNVTLHNTSMLSDQIVVKGKIIKNPKFPAIHIKNCLKNYED